MKSSKCGRTPLHGGRAADPLSQAKQGATSCRCRRAGGYNGRPKPSAPLWLNPRWWRDANGEAFAHPPDAIRASAGHGRCDGNRSPARLCMGCSAAHLVMGPTHVGGTADQPHVRFEPGHGYRAACRHRRVRLASRSRNACTRSRNEVFPCIPPADAQSTATTAHASPCVRRRMTSTPRFLAVCLLTAPITTAGQACQQRPRPVTPVTFSRNARRMLLGDAPPSIGQNHHGCQGRASVL